MNNKDIERSIITKYRKSIWSKFIKAVKEYELIQKNDKIAVCISGGKDSFLLAKLLEELKRHGKFNFELVFLTMDPGYSKETRKQVLKIAKILNIKLNIFNSNIFDVVDNIVLDKPCYMCARMRRGFLYDHAKKLGCNKIALGHHFDDVIETILLNMFYGSEFKTMMPKIHSTNFLGMELIRPMYFIKEHDIIAWSKYNNLKFINCACKFTEKNTEYDSKRLEIKKIISNLKEFNPNIDYNIFKSAENINLDAVIAYKRKGIKYNFLDEYNKGE